MKSHVLVTTDRIYPNEITDGFREWAALYFGEQNLVVNSTSSGYEVVCICITW